MNLTINHDLREVVEAVHYRPSLSILQPLHTQISFKAEAVHALKIASDKAEVELHKFYPDDICELVLNKLHKVINGIIIPQIAKSLAIYISPVFQKVLFLSAYVEEKIIVDESFEIRDLAYSEKQDKRFLLILLSGTEFQAFLSESESLTRLKVIVPDHILAYRNDMPERTENFLDLKESKQITYGKFLRHIDKELGSLINLYNVPVFIVGSEKLIGHFKKLTDHSKAIVQYIHGNYIGATEAELNDFIKPYLQRLYSNQTNQLLEKIALAADQNLLSTGIYEVWKDAVNYKGKLLVIEKNYRFPAQHGAEETIIYELKEPYNHFSYIRDAVDDTIEKVLKSGGDVEFVDDGTLQKFGRIALIKYY